MLNRRTYMHVAAWVLLLAYLPVLLASVLHMHERPAAPECSQCAHHVEHPSHFAQGQVDLLDCLVCHLMTFSYFGVTMLAAALAALQVARVVTPLCGRLAVSAHGVAPLRAPPAGE